MDFNAIEKIKEAGFRGFVSVENLYNFGYASIPEEGGVYMILRRSVSKPVFLSKGTGGYFKEKEPNVCIDVRSGFIQDCRQDKAARFHFTW